MSIHRDIRVPEGTITSALTVYSYTLRKTDTFRSQSAQHIVSKPAPRQRPVFVSGLSISQGGGSLDPEVEAIQRKLLEADEDLTELMNEIMTDMVKVETQVARHELDEARAEAETLRARLVDRGDRGQ